MSNADSIPARLFEHAKQRPSKPAYYTRLEDKWNPTNWKDYAEQVRMAGRAMLGLGIERGKCLAILGNNRPEWAIFSLASMSIGGASAGLYTNTSESDLKEIIYHAECPIVLVEDQKQWEKIQKNRDKLPLLRQIIMMKDASKIDDPFTLSWDDFLACGESIAVDRFEKRLSKISSEQIATYTYKMSSDEQPKGTMLSHENLAWTSTSLAKVIDANPDDSGFSSLPMAQMSEQLFSLHLPVTAGYPVYYSRSIQTLVEDLLTVQPTIFFSIPIIWNQLVLRAKSQIEQLPDSKKKKAKQAMALAAEFTSNLFEGRPSGLLTNIKMGLARSNFLNELKTQLGLKQARFCVNGLSTLQDETLHFFAGLELPIFEAYGEDETSGLAALNLPGATQLGSVGQLLPNTEHKFTNDHHLQLRGPNIFLGYYKNNKMTSEVLQFGWYTTAIQGHCDENGFMFVEHETTDSD